MTIKEYNEYFKSLALMILETINNNDTIDIYDLIYECASESEYVIYTQKCFELIDVFYDAELYYAAEMDLRDHWNELSPSDHPFDYAVQNTAYWIVYHGISESINEISDLKV